MKQLSPNRSLVVFSGGQDSTTCLWWAKKMFSHVEAVSFDYGQKHQVELECAEKIAALAQVSWQILNLNVLEQLGSGSLVEKGSPITIEKGNDALPRTFVPGRNLLFLTAAAALAYKNNCGTIVTGVCQTDYSGYPDCRETTLQVLEEAIQAGMECNIKLATPLMHLTKAESIKLAQDMGAFEALALSHTCYAGQVPPCGQCEACVLRAKGFKEANLKDPLLERVNLA